MIQGFLRISRNIVDWDWYTDANTFRVFMHLLLTANYKDCNYKGVEVKRGQVATSRMEIAKALRMSEQNVRTSLSHLKSTNEITSKSTNKLTIITLCKYDSWQDLTSETNQQTNRKLTVNQPAIEEESNKYNNNNKEKEDTKVSPKKKSARFIKPTVEEVDAYVKEKGYRIDAENFVNYYESKGWLVGKSPMKDWKAACRTWEKNWKENHPQQAQTDLFTQHQSMPTNDDMVINGQIYR